MKKIIGWPAGWVLFWCGHVWSRAVLRFDCMAFTYPVYNNLMGWSLVLNDWADLDIWE